MILGRYNIKKTKSVAAFAREDIRNVMVFLASVETMETVVEFRGFT